MHTRHIYLRVFPASLASVWDSPWLLGSRGLPELLLGKYRMTVTRKDPASRATSAHRLSGPMLIEIWGRDRAPRSALPSPCPASETSNVKQPPKETRDKGHHRKLWRKEEKKNVMKRNKSEGRARNLQRSYWQKSHCLTAHKAPVIKYQWAAGYYQHAREEIMRGKRSLISLINVMRLKSPKSPPKRFLFTKFWF